MEHLRQARAVGWFLAAWVLGCGQGKLGESGTSGDMGGSGGAAGAGGSSGGTGGSGDGTGGSGGASGSGGSGGSGGVSCGSGGPAARGLLPRSKTVANLMRTYLVYLPPAVDPATPVPLVFV